MKLPERLENAITKAYTAYHNNELESGDCSACFVGNLVGGGIEWYYAMDLSRKSIGRVDFELGIKQIKSTGYSKKEILIVESIFENTIENFFDAMDDVEYSSKINAKMKQAQFKGVCAVVEYLCELDNVPNIMEIQSLFEYDKENNPKNELQF